MDNLAQSGLFLCLKIYIYVCHIETLKSFYHYHKMINLLFTRYENVLSVSFSVNVMKICDYKLNNLFIFDLEFHKISSTVADAKISNSNAVVWIIVPIKLTSHYYSLL